MPARILELLFKIKAIIGSTFSYHLAFYSLVTAMQISKEDAE